MVFDLDRIGVKEDEITRDGPGGTPRRVQGAEGIDWWSSTARSCSTTGGRAGAFPGKVLRSNR
jgi:hypothetical protein